MNPSTEFIPFAKPSLGPEEEEAVLRIMRSGWLTTGSETLAFEREFADFVGVPRAMAVNSATSGLHLALEALGIGPGDVVVAPTYTFAST
ncbi:MAG TPA: DegT/DnrJ/EryC1/StrS family aminotransferase, partial [Spirochaetales bacterium]|nr:DegT/DnrJ/EryC1/StrS family aminotransferase [Spirochaetales bacterium]